MVVLVLYGGMKESQLEEIELKDTHLLAFKELLRYIYRGHMTLGNQKDELIANQRELRQEIENRRYIEDELRKRNDEIASSMEHLQLAKDQLVDSERMASLGGLVAGIAHVMWQVVCSTENELV